MTRNTGSKYLNILILRFNDTECYIIEYSNRGLNK